MNKLILIIAGNHQQAERYASDRRLTRSQWRYVADVTYLYGMRGCSIEYTGTWYKRDDCTEILSTVRSYVRSQ